MNLNIITKPRGLLSTPLKNKKNLETYLSRFYKKEVYLLNRLDKDATGLVGYTTSQNLYFELRSRWSSSYKKYVILTTKPLPLGLHSFFLKRKRVAALRNFVKDDFLKCIITLR